MFPQKNHRWDAGTILLGRQLAALRELDHGTLGRRLRGLASGVAVHLLRWRGWGWETWWKTMGKPWENHGKPWENHGKP